jgi:pyruvate dehydrogenase complex dehydrogenase (E1) component
MPVSVILVDAIKGVKRIAAKLAQFDGAYLRFVGDIENSRYLGDELVETCNDDEIWELMYFGHARNQ